MNTCAKQLYAARKTFGPSKLPSLGEKHPMRAAKERAEEELLKMRERRLGQPLVPSPLARHHTMYGQVHRSMLGKEYTMARYGKSAQRSVKRAMHKLKEGSLRSGKSGKRVKSRKQAIAIGLSEARRKGAKVPAKS